MSDFVARNCLVDPAGSVSTGDPTNNSRTVTLPTAAASGDLVIVAARKSTGAGGGEFGPGPLVTSDTRLTEVYRDPNEIAVVWTMRLGDDGSPITVVEQNISGVQVAPAVALAVWRNTDLTGPPVIATGTTTPVVATPKGDAIAVNWSHGSFVTFSVGPPDGYTQASTSGNYYMSASIDYWHDPPQAQSPAGSLGGEGGLVWPAWFQGGGWHVGSVGWG